MLACDQELLTGVLIAFHIRYSLVAFYCIALREATALTGLGLGSPSSAIVLEVSPKL